MRGALFWARFWCGVRRFGLAFGMRCAVLGSSLVHSALFPDRFWCAVRCFGVDFGCAVRRFGLDFSVVRRFGVAFGVQCVVLGSILVRAALFSGRFWVCGAPFWARILVCAAPFAWGRIALFWSPFCVEAPI